MYLIDTNIFLELLLNQEKAGEVRNFFSATSLSLLHVTDFSLFSIGILLIRGKKYAVYQEFIKDIVQRGGVSVLSVSEFDLTEVTSIAERFNLDFDDAYQYTVAIQYDLTIVSYDNHFDRTDKGRKTPGQILS